MKVYIGPYPHWWSVTRFESWITRKIHKVEYSYQVEEEDYTRLEKFIFKFTDAWQWVLNHTVNKVNQQNRTEKIRIDYYDTWSMDNTLALIILPMLKQLKKDKHGAPLVDDKDVPVELRSTSVKKKKKNKWDTDENHFKRWDWVIDEMIWVFEQKVDPDEGRSNYYDPYKPNEKVDATNIVHSSLSEKDMEEHMEMMRKMGKFNRTKYKKYMARKQKALILFGKYFEALWD